MGDKDVRLSRLVFQHGKLKVLEELVEHPGKEYSIKALSDASGASYDLTHRFVGNLADLGIITKRKVGGSVIVQLNEDSPYVETLQELVRIDAQPLVENAEKYAHELMQERGGVQSIILFGSVARGTPDTESDVDVLLLEDVEGVESYANKLASRYEREEQVTIVPVVETWDGFREDLETGAPFAEEVKSDGILLEGEHPW
ncbi:MAG: nucleotidyltransferase domain-containing protein [Candidatus Nanohaloarchaea archaeon]|nr:nucleotidyltransferase domain-containing protein [Candidatus Nanohaloarchaea archaeon]